MVTACPGGLLFLQTFRHARTVPAEICLQTSYYLPPLSSENGWSLFTTSIWLILPYIGHWKSCPVVDAPPATSEHPRDRGKTGKHHVPWIVVSISCGCNLACLRVVSGFGHRASLGQELKSTKKPQPAPPTAGPQHGKHGPPRSRLAGCGRFLGKRSFPRRLETRLS